MKTYNYINTKDNSYELNNYRKLTPTYKYYDTDKTYDGFSLKYNKHYNTYLTPEEKDTLDRNIYHFIKNPKYKIFTNIYKKALLYTEQYPTKEQRQKLKNPKYTIIYSPTPEEANIKNLTKKYQTTRAKALKIIQFNKPTTVYLEYYNYNSEPYTDSIANLQKQLSTHGIPVHLKDLTHNYELYIPPCASGTETTISETAYTQYQNTLQPYRDFLKEAPTTYTRFTESTVCQDILDYISIWAPAYDIQLPDNKLTYTQQQEQLLTIYNQLKAYEHYQLPINDSHTICPHCSKPYSVSFIDNLLPCPHCEQLDQDTINEDLQCHPSEIWTDYTDPDYICKSWTF